MPVEIKELHIRVTVNAGQGGATTSSPAGEGAGARAGAGMSDNNREALIAECVEQVMEILQQKAER